VPWPLSEAPRLFVFLQGFTQVVFSSPLLYFRAGDFRALIGHHQFTWPSPR